MNHIYDNFIVLLHPFEAWKL